MVICFFFLDECREHDLIMLPIIFIFNFNGNNLFSIKPDEKQPKKIEVSGKQSIIILEITNLYRPKRDRH